METPQQVKEAAKDLINTYGDSFQYLGEYDGCDVFKYQFPKEEDVGFPILFLWRDGSTREVSDSDSLHIISSLVKD